MAVPRKTFRLTFSLLLAGLITAAAHAQTPLHPLKPRELFPSSLVNVHSPDGENWFVTGMADNGISFGKVGNNKFEMYGAQLILFALAPTASGDELVKLARERIAATHPLPRYQETEADYRYHEKRGYPCVSVRVTLNDYAGYIPQVTELYRLQLAGLYCRHPAHEKLGFFAAYSRHAIDTEESIDAAAEKFFKGVVALE